MQQQSPATCAPPAALAFVLQYEGLVGDECSGSKCANTGTSVFTSKSGFDPSPSQGKEGDVRVVLVDVHQHRVLVDALRETAVHAPSLWCLQVIAGGRLIAESAVFEKSTQPLQVWVE